MAGREPRVSPDSSALVYLRIGVAVAPMSIFLAYFNAELHPVEIVQVC